MYKFVNKKILADLHISHVILIHFTWLCSLLQWDRKVPIIKVIEIFYLFYDQSKIISDLNMSHGKMSGFVSFPLLRFTLVIKLRNFNFNGYYGFQWIFSDKKNDVSFDYFLSSSVWFGLSFAVWVTFWQYVEKYEF